MMNTPETRHSLIARLAHPQDEDAWEEFVELYQPVIHRIVARRGLQYADVVEVTQEVLAKVAARIEQWSPSGPSSTFRGWLYRVSKNATTDYLKSINRKPENKLATQMQLAQLVDEKNRDDEFYLEYERQLFFWAANKIKSEFLPNNWKAFWLSMVEGIEISQVATQLDLPRGAVYIARSRIVARLRKEIQKRLEETGSPD